MVVQMEPYPELSHSFLTEFSEVRPRRSCIPILQLFEQTLYQEPVHLVDPDSTAHVLDDKLYPVGPCASVLHHQIANIMLGRRSRSGSASLKTSWVTGAV